MNKILFRVLWAGRWICEIAKSILALVFPRNYKKIVFGAWFGKQYTCNPRRLFEYCLQRGGFDCVWIGDKSLEKSVLSTEGARFAAIGSLRAYWHLLTSGFWVWNVDWGTKDTMRFPRCRRVVQFYVGHGYADKYTGKKQYNGSGPGSDICQRGYMKEWMSGVRARVLDLIHGDRSWMSVSSRQSAEITLDNKPEVVARNMLLDYGTPRGDYFINNAHNAALRKMLREKFASLLDLPLNKRWCLFVPTWRHDSSNLFSFLTAKIRDKYEEVLQSRDMILIEKQHPHTMTVLNVQAERIGSIFKISKDQSLKIDNQELLMAADLLITDYSSIYYDFVLMNRPVLHFCYDFEHFMKVDMGFNFDIRKYGGGPFAYTENELLKFMAMSEEALLALRNAKTLEQLEFEKGHSCEQYYDFMMRMSKERGFFVQ